MTTIHHRSYAGDGDIAAIRQFLLDTYALYGSLRNWDPRRWEGSIYHNNDTDGAAYRTQLPELVHLWLTASDQIIGFTLRESDGEVFLQIHPDYRHIESDMLDWAEANHNKAENDGSCWLEVWAYADDTFRNDLLHQRGYVQTEHHDNLRRRVMSDPVPVVPLPEGYTLRAMRHHLDDWHNQASLLNAAFGRDFHNAEEYRNFQSAPSYRAEFDIVAQAPDGTFAANAGFTIHERESFAVLEPVCTHPDHQRKGLARAAIAEGLRRVQKAGIQTAFVGAWYSNVSANITYEKMGFVDPVGLYIWRKQWHR